MSRANARNILSARLSEKGSSTRESLADQLVQWQREHVETGRQTPFPECNKSRIEARPWPAPLNDGERQKTPTSTSFLRFGTLTRADSYQTVEVSNGETGAFRVVCKHLNLGSLAMSQSRGWKACARHCSVSNRGAVILGLCAVAVLSTFGRRNRGRIELASSNRDQRPSF